MFGAGKLNRRIMLRKPSLVDDGFQETQTWTDDRTVWANVYWVSDKEKYLAGAINIETELRVVIRKTTISHDYRVRYQGVEYEVNGITPLVEKEHFLQLNLGRAK